MLHYFSFDAIPQKSGEVRKEMFSYDKRPLEAEVNTLIWHRNLTELYSNPRFENLFDTTDI